MLTLRPIPKEVLERSDYISIHMPLLDPPRLNDKLPLSSCTTPVSTTATGQSELPVATDFLSVPSF